MKKTSAEQDVSPDEIIIRAFESNINPYIMSHVSKNSDILKNTRMQIRSAYSESSYWPPVVVEEQDQFKIYLVLNFDKPLYRKIELLAQLNDEGFQSYLKWLIEEHVKAVLDNRDELADCIQRRIEEEAYDLGREHPNSREDKLKEAKST